MRPPATQADDITTKEMNHSRLGLRHAGSGFLHGEMVSPNGRRASRVIGLSEGIHVRA